jgi:broad specificity phosphatase PhoE
MEQKNKNLCTLYLVRHGETESNKSDIINGHLDAPLTAVGLAQVKITARELKDVSFDAIFFF